MLVINHLNYLAIKPWDINTYLKVQNYGPDQSQGQFWVAVCDVVIPDIYKLDLLTENTWLVYWILIVYSKWWHSPSHWFSELINYKIWARAAKYMEMLLKLQQVQVQYPNCKSCSYLIIKVKCVTYNEGLWCCRDAPLNRSVSKFKNTCLFETKHNKFHTCMISVAVNIFLFSEN